MTVNFYNFVFKKKILLKKEKIYTNKKKYNENEQTIN